MSKVANLYGVDERIRAQRVLPRANRSLASVQQISIDIIGTRTEVRRRGGILPSWVVFAMIILGITAVCITVNMRTQAKAHLAAGEFAMLEADVESLRTVNQRLKTEVQMLKTNPRTIELAARARLNMLRSNEYVVPIK